MARKRIKADWELTIEERIERAGWFKGSEADWKRLTMDERREVAFAGCGCEVAYPSWEAPVDCVHTGCLIRRGKLPQIALTNRILRGEADSGWLRFLKENREGRNRLARIYRAVRRAAIETGIYDPWKIPGGWQVMVASGVNSF